MSSVTWQLPRSGGTKIIGIVGGIGAGKSTVAREFAAQGCLVSDSDAGTREALNRRSIQDSLRREFGDRVIGPDGTIDRKVLAEIIFNDADGRKRLESIIHPELKLKRDALIDLARRNHAPALIIDAPLLIEAGIDAECDAIVYVDAPREVRLQRVQQARGWTEGELARREKSQLGLDVKRSHARFVVINDGIRDLTSQVREILAAVLPEPGQAAS